MTHKEIVIVGGGPIGLTTALLLIKKGLKVTIIDSGLAKNSDGRVLALSHASISLFKELGVWDEDFSTNINEVHISHKGLGISRIIAKDLNLPKLGCTIKYADICHSIEKVILNNNLCDFIIAEVSEVIPGRNYVTINFTNKGSKHCLTAKYCILAEGGMVNVVGLEHEIHDYQQAAVIAQIDTEFKQNGVAYERFGNDGGLVLLPYKSGYTLVWSLDNNLHESLTTELLSMKLHDLPFMERFGRFSVENGLHNFPLKLRFAKRKVIDNVVLIGNSAQTIHPISAQGMNLGLRDAKILSGLLVDAIYKDIQDCKFLKEYDNLRACDTKAVINFTHYLAKFVDIDNMIVNHMRGLGIVGLSHLKPLQNFVARSLIFGN